MENVVEVKNLVKRYKERVALDHLNLSLKEGEFVTILGSNGAGKSTIIKNITAFA